MSETAPEGFAGWAVAAETPDRIHLKHDDGRTLGIRVMDMADMLDLMEAAGPVSSNQAWMNLAIPAVSVDEINGDPVPVPKTKDAIRLTTRKLGNERMAAIIWALFQRKPPAADMEVAKN